MRKCLAIAAVLFLVSSVCYAQDNTPDLKAGSKALLFEFNGLSFITAGNFDGGAGFKYYISPNMAVRGSVMLAHATSVLAANPVTPNTGVDGSQSGTRGGFTAAVERHLAIARVSPYIGGGVNFAMTATESKNIVIGNPPGDQTVIKNNGELGTVTLQVPGKHNVQNSLAAISVGLEL